MPIVEIEVVSDTGDRDPPDASVTQSLVDELAVIFDSHEAGTWLRVRSVPRTQYAENGGPVPPEVQPVFVSILKREHPTEDVRKAEASDIADTVGRILDRSSEFVHIIYEPSGAGRVAFGGTRWA